MQRGLVQALAWVLATGAAVTLSWYGVRTVLTGTAYDPPRALTIAGEDRSTTEVRASSTYRPDPPSPPSDSRSTPPSPGRSSAPPARDTKPDPEPRPTKEPKPEEGGNVRSYPVRGGRVVFDIRDSWADLVSATPDSGWRMQVWKQAQWIRVDFVSGADTTSVFCTWHDGPPRVRVDEP
ncbi:hypothetical protein HUT19_26295 [Streptomyces sp. NA02950]|uniref:hypothetical protein n=1 Tax=Streptomyces sp. NA02950 TaxID=2742137 RepID=UPI00158FAE73|nr:hypothetical protein [Streptomyces sp. NA02950]QKV94824.1 hypothetical protein HUT19_26295 [Streptomyces sp. NA02950]